MVSRTLNPVLQEDVLLVGLNSDASVRAYERLTLGDQLAAGDAIVLLASSGIHANGLSLARKLVERLPRLRGRDAGPSAGPREDHGVASGATWFRLPVGRLTRSAEEGYPEYHSSADDLSLVRPEPVFVNTSTLLLVHAKNTTECLHQKLNKFIKQQNRETESELWVSFPFFLNA